MCCIFEKHDVFQDPDVLQDFIDHIAQSEPESDASHEDGAIIDSEHDVNDNAVESEGMMMIEGEEREMREEDQSSSEPTQTKRIKSYVNSPEMNKMRCYHFNHNCTT